MERTHLRGLAALAAVAALAACADREAPTAPVSPGGVTARADSLQLPPGDPFEGEKELREVAAEVPGYAGHWYENGTRVVALVDPSQQALALRVLDARPQPPLDAPEETGKGTTRFVPARHDFATLRAWRDRSANGVLEVPGATYVDLDEARNRVTVGIVDESARSGVEKQLAAAGVPTDGAIVEVSGPGEQHQLLTQWRRPIEGGWKIQNGLQQNCTLGFVVTPVGGAPSFITNSHCTRAFWKLDGTPFYQPTIAAANLVGNEVSDPAGWAGGICPLGWLCRRSDAARIQITAGVPWVNRVARTTWFGSLWPNIGSIVYFPPAFNFGGNQMYPPGGQWVSKVGQTTGWTRGPVTNTCVLVNAPPPAPPLRRLVCQYYANYFSGAGDSGAPVFLPGGASAVITGLQWGAFPGIGRSVFSPRGGVLADLGV